MALKYASSKLTVRGVTFFTLLERVIFPLKRCSRYDAKIFALNSVASGFHIASHAKAIVVCRFSPSANVMPWVLNQSLTKSIMFQFPPEGTLVEVAFTGGDLTNCLSGRRCRMVPVCRMLSPASSCNSSGRRCRNVLPRRATG